MFHSPDGSLHFKEKRTVVFLMLLKFSAYISNYAVFEPNLDWNGDEGFFFFFSFFFFPMSVAVKLAENYDKLTGVALLPFYCQNTYTNILILFIVLI